VTTARRLSQWLMCLMRDRTTSGLARARAHTQIKQIGKARISVRQMEQNACKAGAAFSPLEAIFLCIVRTMRAKREPELLALLQMKRLDTNSARTTPRST